MREALQPYRGPDIVNYLCIVATELLGENTLRRLPALCAGFKSIQSTLEPRLAQAVTNLRVAGCAPGTLRELHLMVDRYKVHHRNLESTRQEELSLDRRGISRRFLIDESLSIEKTWTQIVPADIEVALDALFSPLPLRVAAQLPVHDWQLPAHINDGAGGFEGVVEPLGFLPPVPPLFPQLLSGKPPGLIRWDELIAVADQYDERDVQNGRQSPGTRSWFRRLHDENGSATARLLRPTEHGLVPAEGMDLRSVKHLIGLPGAGKTTLLYLLAGLMSQRGHRVCYLLPSIEVATAFVEKLSTYGVNCGLLFGQGDTARTKHILNFSAALAPDNQGFAVSRVTAPFFATNCALAGFTADEDDPFPHSAPPCQQLRQRSGQGKKPTLHQCSLSSVCGRQAGERELTSTNIWVGHALSTDRMLSPLFSDTKVRYFEYIARSFDLVVVDECDGTQNALDARGTPLTKLAGDSDSVWDALIQDLHGPAARGRNAFVAGTAVPTLLEMTGRFGRATERLTATVMHFDKKFRSDNANQLLTALSIIADMFPLESNEDEESEAHRNSKAAFERVWDSAAKVIAFRHVRRTEEDPAEEDESDIERELAHAAEGFKASITEVTDFHARVVQALEVWDRDGSEAAMQAVASALKCAPGLKSPHGDDVFLSYTALLTTVSLLVLQHFGLAPHLRLMNSEGLVSDRVFQSRPSRDLLAMVPESLAGRLSGVRYTVSDEGNVDIAQVGFAGTPRMLFERSASQSSSSDLGCAVLLTSATSMLEPSPSFHVMAGPHYVLQRPNAGNGWQASRYRFLPMQDPGDPTRKLRFSGARLNERDRILTAMVDQLLRGGPLSEVESALKSNNVIEGIGRKAGFVVNSYEQAALMYGHIHANYPHWRGRVRYLARAERGSSIAPDAVTASDVEALGRDKKWDLLVFPMNAIGRGVNIVYQFGPRIDRAMLGSLYFLTRPHPRADSLQLIQGMVGRTSEEFDRQQFESTSAALDALARQRRVTADIIDYLLRLPLAVQRLGQYAEPFVADQMIMILQTIGRAMRGDCPAYVYFVDAAWAPRSAAGDSDNANSSMLVMMQSILRRCLSHHDPGVRECYENLYRPFFEPLTHIENLQATE
ncbi:ATP-binding protein [Paraburkholderia fungorum]|uniref:AAA+ ATPase domain-containing protein n=1 Tax=Paraburkholderia fungorum TaxID=134537 RepID=A0AAW3US22_9BURK|nr:ATP-binding protein [Paraburkholderia fungorum]MBB4519747.1 hypothetical protein [Paraburkholderia fungorum]MBB6201224.1 hypothetical protein [Paraburkholderia fungorum]